jgi:hypothetical protein
MPAFLEHIVPPKSIPIEVCVALLQDASRNDLKRFPETDRRRIRALVDEANKATAVIISQNRESKKENTVYELVNQFASLINRDRKLQLGSCFAYWQQYAPTPG